MTNYTYDSYGNMLTKEVGVLSVSGSNVNQPEHAVYAWSYYPADGSGTLTVAGTTYTNQPGNLVKSSSDANGNATYYAYNANKQLAAVYEPNDAGGGSHLSMSYSYDSAGQLAQSVDAIGRTVQYAYDLMGRVTTITYGDNTTEGFLYGTTSGGTGGSGNQNMLIAKKDRNNSVTQYQYDAAGRTSEIDQAAWSLLGKQFPNLQSLHRGQLHLLGQHHPVRLSQRHEPRFQFDRQRQHHQLRLRLPAAGRRHYGRAVGGRRPDQFEQLRQQSTLQPDRPVQPQCVLRLSQ